MQNRKLYYIILSAGFLALSVLALPFGAQGFAAGLQNVPGFGALAPSTDLTFYNTHTRETLTVAWRRGGGYRDAAMEDIDRFLRDHRNGHVHEIDSGLLDLLSDLQGRLRDRHPDKEIVFNVISGFRSRETNDNLRAAGGGQGKKSQHIEGKAIDIRIPGIESKEIRDIAWCLQRGGVGWYKGSDFVHVDTGKIRFWNWRPDSKTCGTKNNS